MKMIAIDLRLMLIQKQYNRLEEAGNTTMYFIPEKIKETILDFSQGTVRVL